VGIEHFSNEKKVGLSSRKLKKNFPHVVSITSGKGGVGKTLTTVNLALSARRLGLKVLILDGDMGLANVDVVLGLQARYNINDVLEGRIGINNIILDGPLGIKIIPSGSGISQLAQLSFVQRVALLEQLEQLNEDFDLLIIDTSAGIADTVLHLNSVAEKSIVVTTPEPHAMTDAYAMIKILSENQRQPNISLLVNMAKSEAEGRQVFERLSTVADRFIGKDLDYIGFVPFDPQIQKAIIQRRAASEVTTHTNAGQAWNKIAQTIFDNHSSVNVRDQDQIWRELVWANQDNAQVSRI